MIVNVSILSQIKREEMLLKKVFYLGMIGFNDLGDDLLWNLFKKNSNEIFGKKQVSVTTSLPGVNITKFQKYDTLVLGGESIITPQYTRLLYKAINGGKNIGIWRSGIDRIAFPRSLFSLYIVEQAM